MQDSGFTQSSTTTRLLLKTSNNKSSIKNLCSTAIQIFLVEFYPFSREVIHVNTEHKNSKKLTYSQGKTVVQ